MIEIFDYSTQRYPLREWAQYVLGTPHLEALHEHECGGAKIIGHRTYRFINALKAAFTDDIASMFSAFALEYGAPRVDFKIWDRISPMSRVAVAYGSRAWKVQTIFALTRCDMVRRSSSTA